MATTPAQERAIRKSKSLKHQVLGTFLEVESVFRVAGAGISIRCKIHGWRRSSWGLRKRWQAWWIWRGSDTMRFAWQAQGFRALWCRCLKHPTLNPWEGCKFHVTEVLLCRDHFAWQLQEFVCLGSTFSWQAQYFWSIQLKIVKTYWNSEVKCLVDMSFLKEVSQKSFVFELQSFIFEGSLAETLRFWASKLQFWRKSRRKASFLIFKASFLKEVSHRSFVFELQSFNFEGSLAEKLRFWSSKLRFWRKSRRKASFDKTIWITHQLTTKSLEPQIIWHPNHLNLKSIDNQITWISDQLTTESLESQINWQPHHLKFKPTDNQNHLKHTSIDNQIIWISNQLTTKSIESQINWQPKPFESQIRWQPNHLTLNSFESDINWLSNQLNSAHSLPIGSLSLETSATALCGRYVRYCHMVLYVFNWFVPVSFQGFLLVLFGIFFRFHHMAWQGLQGVGLGIHQQLQHLDVVVLHRRGQRRLAVLRGVAVVGVRLELRLGAAGGWSYTKKSHVKKTWRSSSCIKLAILCHFVSGRRHVWWPSHIISHPKNNTPSEREWNMIGDPLMMKGLI